MLYLGPKFRGIADLKGKQLKNLFTKFLMLMLFTPKSPVYTVCGKIGTKGVMSLDHAAKVHSEPKLMIFFSISRNHFEHKEQLERLFVRLRNIGLKVKL
jgi:hypothetical protein